MKYTPKILTENVNVSQPRPFKEFLILVVGIFGSLMLLYWMMGVTLDILVEKVPEEIETALHQAWSKSYPLEPSSPAEQKAQALLDSLVEYLPVDQREFKVHLIDSQDVNAVALPGGHILLFSGLVEKVESENELAMVLAHELGHFMNRDHLRAIGRRGVVVFFSAIISGTESGLTDLLSGTINLSEMKYSRSQETAADQYGIDLVYKKYGHVSGAFDFFKRCLAEEKIPEFLQFTLSHPHDKNRLEFLKEEAARLDYPADAEKTPLDPELKSYQVPEKQTPNLLTDIF